MDYQTAGDRSVHRLTEPETESEDLKLIPTNTRVQEQLPERVHTECKVKTEKLGEERRTCVSDLKYMS